MESNNKWLFLLIAVIGGFGFGVLVGQYLTYESFHKPAIAQDNAPTDPAGEPDDGESAL